MRIEDILQEALDAYGGSQQDLSVALGVSHSTVSRWLSNRGKPTEGSCLRLARITGRPPREVFGAAGHDANLLPPDAEGPSTPEADEVRARVIRRLERDRMLAEMPEDVRAAAEAALDDLTRHFHQLGRRQAGDPVGAVAAA